MRRPNAGSQSELKPLIESRLSGTIRRCDNQDLAVILQIINEAATANKAVLPPHVYHEPQMTMQELQQETKRVSFLAYEKDGNMLGVMGYEFTDHVALIRHAYTRRKSQGKGIGSLLLTRIEEIITNSNKATRIIIGTYTRAYWAIHFYEKHGYQKSSNPQVILTKYYDIPEVQQSNSLTLEKALARAES
jgi:GNAT superfamily N-acetyltransferase